MPNPFDKYDDNPFADAAVMEAADEEPMATEDLSQPEEKSKGKKGKKGKKENDAERLFDGPSSSSAPHDPPPYGTDLSDATRRKEEELERKERELQAKEREIQEQARIQAAAGSPKTPNWPICYPYFYFNIKEEIPVDHQKTVRNLYYSWLLTAVSLGINMIGCFCRLIAGQGGQDFGFAIMYFVLITPLSFFLWYRPVYNAYMKDTSFYFVTFLFFNFWHILFVLYLIIGIPDTGGAGFINVIDLFAKKTVGEAVVMLLALLFWIFAVVVHIILFKIVYTAWKSRGHTLQSARNQAISTAARSEAGREAFSVAASSAAQGMANNYTRV